MSDIFVELHDAMMQPAPPNAQKQENERARMALYHRGWVAIRTHNAKLATELLAEIRAQT